MIHWPTQPPTHPSMGGGVSTNHKSSNRIQLSWLGQHLKIFSDLTWPNPWTTHPLTHQTTHLPIGGGVSTDFKSSNRIEISWFDQYLLTFDWFLGSPIGGGGGWMGVGVCQGVWRMSLCTCTHACMCAHMSDDFIMGFPREFPMGAAICMKLSCLYMYAHACAYTYMCVHVWGTPKHPDRLPPHPPTPNPKGEPLKLVRSQ